MREMILTDVSAEPLPAVLLRRVRSLPAAVKHEIFRHSVEYIHEAFGLDRAEAEQLGNADGEGNAIEDNDHYMHMVDCSSLLLVGSPKGNVVSHMSYEVCEASVYLAGAVVKPQFSGRRILEAAWTLILSVERPRYVAVRSQHPVVFHVLQNKIIGAETPFYPICGQSPPPDIGHVAGRLLAKIPALASSAEAYDAKTCVFKGLYPQMLIDAAKIKARPGTALAAMANRVDEIISRPDGDAIFAVANTSSWEPTKAKGRGLRALILGCGAVAQVIGASLHKGGGEVAFAVRRPEYVNGDRRLKRLPLLSISRCQRCVSETLPSDMYSVVNLHDVVNGDHLLANRYDVCIITLPGDVLRMEKGAWMARLAAKLGSCVLVNLSSGISTDAFFRDVVRIDDEKYIEGVITFIAYQAPDDNPRTPIADDCVRQARQNSLVAYTLMDDFLLSTKGAGALSSAHNLAQTLSRGGLSSRCLKHSAHEEVSLKS